VAGEEYQFPWRRVLFYKLGQVRPTLQPDIVPCVIGNMLEGKGALVLFKPSNILFDISVDVHIPSLSPETKRSAAGRTREKTHVIQIRNM